MWITLGRPEFAQSAAHRSPGRALRIRGYCAGEIRLPEAKPSPIQILAASRRAISSAHASVQSTRAGYGAVERFGLLVHGDQGGFPGPSTNATCE